MEKFIYENMINTRYTSTVMIGIFSCQGHKNFGNRDSVVLVSGASNKGGGGNKTISSKWSLDKVQKYTFTTYIFKTKFRWVR